MTGASPEHLARLRTGRSIRVDPVCIDPRCHQRVTLQIERLPSALEMPAQPISMSIP